MKMTAGDDAGGGALGEGDEHEHDAADGAAELGHEVPHRGPHREQRAERHAEDQAGDEHLQALEDATAAASRRSSGR